MIKWANDDADVCDRFCLIRLVRMILRVMARRRGFVDWGSFPFRLMMSAGLLDVTLWARMSLAIE